MKSSPNHGTLVSLSPAEAVETKLQENHMKATSIFSFDVLGVFNHGA
jgi:hypothetical protein